jgi:hypothetical protein
MPFDIKQALILNSQEEKSETSNIGIGILGEQGFCLRELLGEGLVP